MDTREQSNFHIIDYFAKKKIKYEIKKIDTGDYSFYIQSNEDTKPLGIDRDIYFNSYVERKNGVDEIVTNLVKSNGTPFENELIRSQGSKFVLFVEDLEFDYKVSKGLYISKYDPKALRGRLDSLQAKYNFEIRPVDKSLMGHLIYHRFKYQAKHYLKNGTF